MGWEDPLEEGMATHSSFLAWRKPEDLIDFFNWGMNTCPSVQAGERLKLVLQRTYQENGAFFQEKRRDMRAHVCLKSCRAKEEADLFCNHFREKSEYRW